VLGGVVFRFASEARHRLRASRSVSGP
jgi:hypothetical protein